MYSQGLIGADSATEETQEFLDRFQARIEREDKIEPNDPMPEGYRRTLIRMIGQHAHSEIVGMLPGPPSRKTGLSLATCAGVTPSRGWLGSKW